jgi:hypothetical protein
MLSDTEDIVEAVVYLAEARHVTGEVFHVCEKLQFAASRNWRTRTPAYASPCRRDASNQKTLTSAGRALVQPQHDNME